MDTRTKEVVKVLAGRIADLDKALAEFSKGLKTDPVHALEWADGIFEGSARRQVFETVRDALAAPDSKATLVTLREYATRQALNGAKHPKQSTSTCSNLMNRYLTAAWADLTDTLVGELRP